MAYNVFSGTLNPAQSNPSPRKVSGWSVSHSVGLGYFFFIWSPYGIGQTIIFDKLYSPQMVVTANTTKYTIENDLTKKRKKEKNKQTHRQNGMYLSKKRPISN